MARGRRASVATVILTLSTTSFSQAKRTHQDRITPFENLDVSYSSVGNVCMDAGSAVPCRACSRTPGDCLWRNQQKPLMKDGKGNPVTS